MSSDPLLHARALVLDDLAACGSTDAAVVSMVEDVVAGRRSWVEQWPEGAAYVAGQVAQDVQDRMIDEVARWPLCPRHRDGPDAHELHIEPALGADSHWVCDTDGVSVAPLGALGRDPH
ncbi:MAG: hypothetical protein M3Q27_01285 [Actinomycetota bacterium]|nr:hypothetical protein [Actinomycetota bacterium]